MYLVHVDSTIRPPTPHVECGLTWTFREPLLLPPSGPHGLRMAPKYSDTLLSKFQICFPNQSSLDLKEAANCAIVYGRYENIIEDTSFILIYTKTGIDDQGHMLVFKTRHGLIPTIKQMYFLTHSSCGVKEIASQQCCKKSISNVHRRKMNLGPILQQWTAMLQDPF